MNAKAIRKKLEKYPVFKAYFAMPKKRRTYMLLGIGIGFLYLYLLLLCLHISGAVEDHGGSYSYAMEGIEHFHSHPFAIFPLPKGALLVFFDLTLIFGIVFLMAYLTTQIRKHYNPDTVQGDAKWMKELDDYNRKFTEPFDDISHDGYNNMILSQDIYMSMNNQKIRRNMNVFVIGGSGAGKSFNLVGPNLMQANASYVITDPSGGLYKQYGPFFEYMGYKVKCFNLDHMDRGNHYNPFAYIHSDKDIEVLVTTLISNTTPPNKQGGDPFWEKSETALLVALIAYLYHYTKKADQNFSNVMRLMRQADVNENDSSSQSPLDYLFEEIESKDPESFAVKQYKTFKMGAGKTLKGILISCAVRLQAFDLEDVARLTDTDDIELDTVGDERTALFVIIPTGEKTFNFLASMMYSQLFQRMYGYCENSAEYSQCIIDSDHQIVKTYRAEGPEQSKLARAEAEAYFERIKKAKIIKNRDYKWWEIRTEQGELVTYRGTEAVAYEALDKIKNGRVIQNNEQSNHGQRLPVHTRFMLDEFANTGKIPEFSEKVATIRKYEISVTIILQSLQQMKNLYEKDWETVTGNCDSTIYLGGGADTVTTEWISKLLGKETRVVLNSSFSGKSGGSTSLNRVGVELYAPAQLRTMPEDECIVLLKSMYAYKGLKYLSIKHPMWDLVTELEKDGYSYNERKTTYLYNQSHTDEERIERAHGKSVRNTKEEDEMREKQNQAKEQAAQEKADNRDHQGNQIVGDQKKIDVDKDELKDHLNITDETSLADSLDQTLEESDANWGLDELNFGTAQGGGIGFSGHREEKEAESETGTSSQEA